MQTTIARNGFRGAPAWVVHVPVARDWLNRPYWNLSHEWVREFVADAGDEIAFSPSLSGGFIEDAGDEIIVRSP